MSDNMTALVKQRQEALQSRYITARDEARIADHAVAESGSADPFHESFFVLQTLRSNVPVTTTFAGKRRKP